MCDTAFRLNEDRPLSESASTSIRTNIGNKLGRESLVSSYDLWHLTCENTGVEVALAGGTSGMRMADVLTATAQAGMRFI